MPTKRCFAWKQVGLVGIAMSVAVGSGGQGRGHAAMVTWSGVHKAEVKDPGNGETAFTVDVPNGWKFVGTMLRPAGCHAPSVPADGLSYTDLSPDNLTAIGQMPGASWMWASDGSSPLGPRCAPVNLASANAFLLNIVVPNAHPQSRIVTVETLTGPEQQAIQAQRDRPPLGPTRMTLDIGRIVIEYAVDGVAMEEQLGTVMTCQETNFPAYPQMHRAARVQRLCSSHGTYFKRAPKGYLAQLVGEKFTTAQVDRAWDAQIAQQMRSSFAAYQEASDRQFASIQKHFSDQTAGMLQRGRDQQVVTQRGTDMSMRQAAATSAATSHMAHQQVLDSLNRQDFVDPTTGRKIETSNQYSHTWVGSDKDTVVQTNDPTFDPNGMVDPARQSWTELIPVS